ncbi:hypothetical protein HDIA_3381 [Hartmannibacter diazotrophicus]|uniref:Uncharacterized protein n=1 Tax=Hartmannibacter diazotrophicus TaxID=1482074 RepID=A0A2C9D9D5_9HYPH|nr:hypothetical protein [Hartmannibacter diazotrophicus]SON56922.1 hypothetical protein HDIA_3381 [Hartmannibacter diazotrophicus]
MRSAEWLRDSVTPADPLQRASHRLSLAIAANKPFYPFYFVFMVGDDAWASLWTMLSMPIFLTIPLLGRRWPTLARVLVPLIGMVDTIFITKLFGEASGTELFLAPCVMIAALSFRHRERHWAVGLAGFAFVAFAVLHGRFGEPLAELDPQALHRLFELNAYSVASLLFLVTWLFAGQAEASGTARRT